MLRHRLGDSGYESNVNENLQTIYGKLELTMNAGLAIFSVRYNGISRLLGITVSTQSISTYKTEDVLYAYRVITVQRRLIRISLFG